MILVGARFRALAGARAALRAVRASVGVVPGDVGVRPLGTTRYEAPVEDFVLAGRFEPEDVERVIRILHAHGGRILVRRIDSPRAVEPLPSVRRRAAVVRHVAPRVRSTSCRRPRKRLRRPAPPLRVRTARRHRIVEG